MIDNKEVDYNKPVRHYADQIITIKSLLVGGSTDLAFLNVHGAPSGNKNSDKHLVFQQFTA